jgi:hypothetical protein
MPPANVEVPIAAVADPPPGASSEAAEENHVSPPLLTSFLTPAPGAPSEKLMATPFVATNVLCAQLPPFPPAPVESFPDCPAPNAWTVHVAELRGVIVAVPLPTTHMVVALAAAELASRIRRARRRMLGAGEPSYGAQL